MKIENVKPLWDGPLHSCDSVAISGSKEEIQELTAALAVVKRWRDMAINAVPCSETADWLEDTYILLPSEDLVLVRIETGAIG